MKTVSIDLVQKSELTNKQWFIKLIQDLPQDKFELFCKEIMHLNQHYVTTVGLYATDQESIYSDNEKYMLEIDSIDFDSEVNFKQIS